jgi:hypothetical protein
MKIIELIAAIVHLAVICNLYVVFRLYAGWSAPAAFIAALPLGYFITWIMLATIGWIRSREKSE